MKLLSMYIIGLKKESSNTSEPVFGVCKVPSPYKRKQGTRLEEMGWGVGGLADSDLT